MFILPIVFILSKDIRIKDRQSIIKNQGAPCGAPLLYRVVRC